MTNIKKKGMRIKVNEDMSNVMNQFSNILKEKNIDINQILNKVADSPTSNSNANTTNAQTSFNTVDTASNTSNDFNLDIETILKIKNIMQQMNTKNVPRNNLLNSLKPFLRKEKQEKLDEYIKYANLLNILELFNSNGGAFSNDHKSDNWKFYSHK